MEVAKSLELPQPHTGPMVTVLILETDMYQVQPNASIRLKAGTNFRVKESLARIWEETGKVEVVR